MKVCIYCDVVYDICFHCDGVLLVWIAEGGHLCAYRLVSMCTCVCVCVCVCVCMCGCVCVCVYVFLCACILAQVCVYVFVCMRASVCDSEQCIKSTLRSTVYTVPI